MAGIEERLDQVRTLIRNNDFLEGKGLSNEVNIRIVTENPDVDLITETFSFKEIIVSYQVLICKGGIYPPIHHDCGSFVVNGCGYEERSSILPVTVD